MSKITIEFDEKPYDSKETGDRIVSLINGVIFGKTEAKITSDSEGPQKAKCMIQELGVLLNDVLSAALLPQANNQQCSSCQQCPLRAARKQVYT